MTPAEELQDAILAALLADEVVSEMVGDRVFDGRPSDSDFPCVSFGPSDTVPEDHECIVGTVETLQIDCWVREDERRALWPTKALRDAVKAALHERDLPLGDHALVSLRVVATRAFLDPDGLTGHGVVTVEADLEEN